MSGPFMRAVVLSTFGEPEVLTIREIPRPEPRPGWVLIRVHAFGLNRSELHFRRGMGSFGSLPRVPGIEAVGTVVAAPGGEVSEGAQVAAVMGGMGRNFDGGYAEYTLVPASTVIPFESTLPWDVLGAVPEMIQTAYGSLTVADAARGASVLIRGGTSSVGLAAAVLAKRMGLSVFSTTRSESRRGVLERVGVDHVLVDDNHVAGQVRSLLPSGVDAAIELVGTPTLQDTLRATARGGTVSFTGMLSDEWTVENFYPLDYIPKGVRLTSYYGEAEDLPGAVLQQFLDAVAAGDAVVPVGRAYDFDQIVQAHRDMESGNVAGKLVVTVDM